MFTVIRVPRRAGYKEPLSRQHVQRSFRSALTNQFDRGDCGIFRQLIAF